MIAGKYKVVKELGRGGMGVVYLTWDVQLQRYCALKYLLSRVPEQIARFKSEAQAMAQMEHPNIIKVHEICIEQSFFVMEYIEGCPLDEFIINASLKKKLQVFHKICTAISFAHKKGVYHRDLKPANILVKNDGEPIVLDFGIAKNVKQSVELTHTGEIIGSPKYMSPETIRGVKVDERSDVYSLGVILYQMLTNKVPFDGDSVMEIFFQLSNHKPILPSKLNSKIKRDSDLEIICLKALEKQKEQRIESVHFLAEEIHSVLQNKPIRLRPLSKMQRALLFCQRNITVVISGLIVSLALLVGAVIVNAGQAQANLLLSEKNEQAKQDIIRAKKDTIRSILDVIAIRHRTSEVMLDYSRLQDAYRLLRSLAIDDIIDLASEKREQEEQELAKLYQELNEHLKFLVLPRFPESLERITIKEDGSQSENSLLSPQGKYILKCRTHQGGSKLFLWDIHGKTDLNEKNVLDVFPAQVKQKQIAIFSHDERYLFYINAKSEICLYDIATKSIILSKKNGYLSRSLFTPDSNYAVFCSQRQEQYYFFVYNLKNKEILPLERRRCDYIFVSNNSRWVCFCENDNDAPITLFDLQKRKYNKIPRVYKGDYTPFFSSEGDQLFVMYSLGLYVYNCEKPEKHKIYHGLKYAHSENMFPIAMKNRFAFFNRQDGLILGQAFDQNISYEKVSEESTGIFSFIPVTERFLGVVQEKRLQIHDVYTGNIICNLALEPGNMIESANVFQKQDGFYIHIASNRHYSVFYLKHTRSGINNELKKIMSNLGSIVKNTSSRSKVILKNNAIIYSSPLGFVVWKDGVFDFWQSYRFVISGGGIRCFITNPQQNEMFVANRFGEFDIHSLDNKNTHRKMRLQNRKIKDLHSFCFDGDDLIITDRVSGVFRKNITSKKMHRIFPNLSSPRMVASTKNGELIFGLSSGQIAVGFKSGEIIYGQQTILSEIKFLKVCDELRMFIAANEKEMQIWYDFTNPQLLHTFKIANIMDVSFSPDKNYFAVFQRNKISIYRVVDFLQQTTKKQKYEMYYGYNKQSIGFSDDWNQAAFSEGGATTLVFAQDYICNKNKLVEKITKCDIVSQKYFGKEKGIAKIMEDIDMYLAKKK